MRKLLFLFVMFLLIGCKPEKQPIDISFYYWKTTFDITKTEQQYLDDLNVKKLYIRYFDVALQDQKPFPVAPIEFTTKPKSYNVVPVVYIKNEVFLKKISVDSLAQNIHRYIQQINKTAEVTPNEVQFDCDWSLKSKENYFQFLKSFKKLQPNISATLRLHQIKYPEKTGIPNVSSGTLMYYNMGIVGPSKTNSIYTRETANNYTKSLQHYNLPIDIALPIFSWGVHIRNKQVTNLIGGLRQADLENKLFTKTENNRYKVIKDVVYKGRYLAKNDEIKLEVISAEQLQEMMDDIRENSKQKPNEVIFYDLNENNLKAYEKEDFKTVSNW